MVGGLIEEIYVNVGSRVEEGQPLLRMRQKDFEINVLRLSEAKRLAEAEYRDAERDLEHAIAPERNKRSLSSNSMIGAHNVRYRVRSSVLQAPILPRRRRNWKTQ